MGRYGKDAFGNSLGWNDEAETRDSILATSPNGMYRASHRIVQHRQAVARPSPVTR